MCASRAPMKRLGAVLGLVLVSGLATGVGCVASEPVNPGIRDDQAGVGTGGTGAEDWSDGGSSGDGGWGDSTSQSSTSTDTGTGTGGSTSSGDDCCTASDSGGCAADSTVESCVCGQDAYCCDTKWDDTCVGEIDTFGCGQCGTGGGQPQGGQCCTASDVAGCSDDATVESCVCGQDSFCCSSKWDQTCVDEVTSFGCGTC